MILNIKTAVHAQIPQMAEVCASCMSHDTEVSAKYDENYFATSLKDSLLVSTITCDRIVRGVCVCDGSPIPDSCEITVLYVSAGYQSHGFGKKLLSHSLREMRARHYKTVFLWLDERNTRASSFFKKIGFEADGKKRIGDGSCLFYEIRYRIDI